MSTKIKKYMKISMKRKESEKPLISKEESASNSSEVLQEEVKVGRRRVQKRVPYSPNHFLELRSTLHVKSRADYTFKRN
jgi:hypothetical protein